MLHSDSTPPCGPASLYNLTHAGQYTLGVLDAEGPAHRGCVASSSWAEAASLLAAGEDPADAEEECGAAGAAFAGSSDGPDGASNRLWRHVRRHQRLPKQKSRGEGGKRDKAASEVALAISARSRQVETSLRPGTVQLHLWAAARSGGGGGPAAPRSCVPPFSGLLSTSLLPKSDVLGGGERPPFDACALVAPGVSPATRARLRAGEALFTLDDAPYDEREVLRVLGARATAEALAGRPPAALLPRATTLAQSPPPPPLWAPLSADGASAEVASDGGGGSSAGGSSAGGVGGGGGGGADGGGASSSSGGGKQRTMLLLDVRDKEGLAGVATLAERLRASHRLLLVDPTLHGRYLGALREATGLAAAPGSSSASSSASFSSASSFASSSGASSAPWADGASAPWASGVAASSSSSSSSGGGCPSAATTAMLAATLMCSRLRFVGFGSARRRSRDPAGREPCLSAAAPEAVDCELLDALVEGGAACGL